MRARDIAKAIAAEAAKMRRKYPDEEMFTSAGIDANGKLKIRKSNWPEGVTISIPTGCLHGQISQGEGADVTVGFEKGRRQLPFLKSVLGGGRKATSGSGLPLLVFGIWQQSEGFPTLLGGPLAVSTMPDFGASPLFAPGSDSTPTGYQDRIGWSGTALASEGTGRFLLYLSTRYNDADEFDPTTDAIGLTIHEWDLAEATLVEYTINFASPFVSDEGGSPVGSWFNHRLGSFFYNPEDGLITIATPYGLYCMGRVQDSEVLTEWSADSARVSKDLSFSCAWFHALQHGWKEQEGGTDGPVLRGWVRERNSKDWVEQWTKALTDLCGELTPGRIYGSGQTDRYDGYQQPNYRATYETVNRRWLVGVAVNEDTGWDFGDDSLTGRAGIVVNALSGDSGAVVAAYTIEANTERIEVRADLLDECTAQATTEQAALLEFQKSVVADNDRAPNQDGNETGDGIWGPGGIGWPAKVITVSNYPGTNPAVPVNTTAIYHVTLNGEAVYPSGISGIVAPAPGFDHADLFSLFAPTQGLARLRKGDDGNFWTVVFRARQIVTDYSISSVAMIDEDYGSVEGEVLTYEVLSSSADQIGDGYTDPPGTVQAQTPILTRPQPLQAAIDHGVYETLLICLSPAMTEVSNTDISLKFLQYGDSLAGPQTVPTPSWRNVSDWAVRGRVIWILRDCYYTDTDGETLTEPSHYKPCLEVWDLSTKERLHRIPLYTADGQGGTVKLLTGIQAAGDLEWAEVSGYGPDSTQRLLRVQMKAALDDTPDISRHTRSGVDFPASDYDWDHQVVYAGHSYFPGSLGTIFKST